MTEKRIAYPRTTPSQRRQLFEIWQQTGNARAACRQARVSEGTFYYWKPRFESGGKAALEDFKSHAPLSPACCDEERKQRVIRLKETHPKWGKRRIADELAKANGWVPLVSPNTVRRILVDAGLWRPVATPRKKKKSAQSVEPQKCQVRRLMPTSALCQRLINCK